VGNEMFVIVEVLAEARRCPLMSSIHRSAWNRNSPKFGVSLVSRSTYCSGAHTLP
jgi:hypothetical protein